MNISPINFAGTTNFQDMISKPQAYTAAQPAASTSIKKEGKSHKGLKIAAGVAAAAALVAGALVLGVNKKVFINKTNNKVLNQINPYLQQAGTAIKNAFTTVRTEAQKIWGSISERLPQMGKKAGETVEEAAETIAQG